MMALFNILFKNFKTVARNPFYFFVLLVGPIILILLAGLMINSVDFKNIRVGIVGNENLLVGSGIENIEYYASLENCLFDIGEKRINLCLNKVVSHNGTLFEIYLDNSNRMLKSYSRQIMLANLIEKQSLEIDTTLNLVDDKITNYSFFVSEIRQELLSAKDEISLQKQLNEEYQVQLDTQQKEFDKYYSPIKQNEQQILQNREDFKNLKTSFNSRYAVYQTNHDNFILSLNNLRSYLVGSGVANSSELISEIDLTLSQSKTLDDDLETFHRITNDPTLNFVLDNLEDIISQMDEVNSLMKDMKSDLSVANSKLEESGGKIDFLIHDLDGIQSDLNNFDHEVGSGRIDVKFFDSFDFTDDAVYLIFPLIVSIIIMFTSLILPNMFVLKLINDRNYLRDVISPVWDVTFVFADYFLNLFFIFIQAAILFSFGILFFETPFYFVYPYLLAIFFISSIFVFVGMGIAHIVKNQGFSMLVTVFLVMILLVFSNLFLPSSLSSPMVRFFVELNPFVLLEEFLSDIFLKGRGIGLLVYKFISSFVYLFVAFLFCLVAKKIGRMRILK